MLVAGDEIAHAAQGVAHGHRAADQILLKAIVREAQEVMLVGQKLKALVEVALHRFRASGAGQPQTGELADDHDQNQSAQIDLFREIGLAARIQHHPGEQQDAGAANAGQRTVAQGEDDGGEPCPGEIALRP